MERTPKKTYNIIRYITIIMATNSEYAIIFFFLALFVVLEFSLVIIPAMLNRSKIKRRYRQSEFDIPQVLERGASFEDRARIRSWYFDRNDSHWHTGTIPHAPPAPVYSGDRNQDSFALRPAPRQLSAEPGTVGITAKSPDRTISNAQAGVQQAGLDDLMWIDEISELNPLLSPVKNGSDVSEKKQ